MRIKIPVIFYTCFLMACSGKQEQTKSDQTRATPKADTIKTVSAQAAFDPREIHRPQFHFTPPSMWMNDPNGMVYHKGEYHLFYQHYPDSTVWGPMHWGHAVSKDMIQWEHLPIALYPDSLGYIFSGSAVVDENNTSGFGSKENPALVAMFTYHLAEGEKAGRNDYQTQGIAYSLDNGRTWEKYKQNPVIKNPGVRDFRDPKVFWHQGSKQWVVLLAVADHVELYGSKNLKNWTKLSEFGQKHGSHAGVWECPDLFPLKVDGQQTEKWVLLLSINPGGLHGGSGTQYFIGKFDGKTFTSDNPGNTTLWLDYGKDNYAGVTWSDIPAADGRRLFMGWMSNWQYATVVPTTTWRSAMTIPRELSLKNTAKGLRVIAQPVKELSVVRENTIEIPSQTITSQIDLTHTIPFNVSTSELVLEFDSIQVSKDFGVELSNSKGQELLLGYESVTNQFYIDRTSAGKNNFSKDFAGRHTGPRLSVNKSIKLHVLLDVASAELFADNGEVVMTDIFFPDETFNQLRLYTKDGSVRLRSGSVSHIRSIWQQSSQP